MFNICFHKWKPLVIIDNDGEYDYFLAATKQKCIKCGQIREELSDRPEIIAEYSRIQNKRIEEHYYDRT